MSSIYSGMTTLPVKVSGERKLRMVVLGTTRTGKTQIMSQFMGREFSDTYLPSIEQYHRKIYTIRGITYQLDILETAGMSTNPINRKITLMSGDVFLVVYSITDAASFEWAKEMIGMIEQAMLSLETDAKLHCAHMKHWNCKKKSFAVSIPIILAGNKCDLESEREVSRKSVSDWLESDKGYSPTTRIEHVEVSAKDSSSVQTMFEKLFSIASLPLEMSPQMHRRVSTSTFMQNAASRKHSEINFLHHRDEAEGKFKKFVKQHNPALLRRWKDIPESSLSSSSSSVNSNSSDEVPVSHTINHDKRSVSLEAIATVFPNQRRPSTATEMSQVMDKAKRVHHTHVLPGFRKLKIRLSRVTSSHN